LSVCPAGMAMWVKQMCETGDCVKHGPLSIPIVALH
jgi:hypothetical protein